MAEPSPVRPLAVLTKDKSAVRAMAVVQELLRGYHPRDFAVELLEGTRWDPEPGQFCRFTWRINNAGGLRAAIAGATQVSLGEAYIYGNFDIPETSSPSFKSPSTSPKSIGPPNKNSD